MSEPEISGGPAHYDAAQRLINTQHVKVVPGYGPVIGQEADPELVAVAQVHALLAIADFLAMLVDMQPGPRP